MVAREAGGFVLEKRVSTNAPKGDTFVILIQMTGQPEGTGTRVRSSFKVMSHVDIMFRRYRFGGLIPF